MSRPQLVSPTLLLNDDDGGSGPVLSSSSERIGGTGGRKTKKSPSLPSPLTRKVGAGLETCPNEEGEEEGALNLQTSFLESDLDDLIQELTNLGFDVPAEFVATHSPDRIRQAIARAKSLPNVKNIPGLIRYLTTKPGPIPAPRSSRVPDTDPDKYIRGKYGHLVRR